MGIYSNSYTTSAPINVPLIEGYDDDEYSAQVAMIESYQNSLAIFDGVIRSDIQESAMKYSGASDYEVMAFSEGVIGDVFNKIKEFFKKLWAKIKSIFHNFMAKWDSKMMSSNKEFIKKYRKDIYGKDLTDLEVEMRKKKSTSLTFSIKTDDLSVHGIYNGKTTKEIDTEIEKFDTNDYTCDLLGATMGGSNGTGGVSISNPSEYEKEAMDYLFEDSDKEEVGPQLNNIITEMMSFKTGKKDIEKSNKDLNKAISDIIKLIEKDQDEVLKKLPGDGSSPVSIKRRKKYNLTSTDNAYGSQSSWKGGSDDSDNNDKENTASGLTRDDADGSVAGYQKALNLVHKRASCIQTAATKFTAMQIKQIKFNNAQNRRIIAKVIAYKRKEEAFSEAFADLVEWEADCVGVY